MIQLLTSNPSKFAAANAIFKPFGLVVEMLDLNIPEIQAESSQKVANAAAIEAYSKTKQPVIREDHSFYITSLGFPGPFMSYIDKSISPEQLLKIIEGLDDKTGFFELAAAYIDKKGKLHEFNYKVPIEFADNVRGDKNQRWERLIKLPSDSRVFAEYPESERADLWTKNFAAIAELITKN